MLLKGMTNCKQSARLSNSLLLGWPRCAVWRLRLWVLVLLKWPPVESQFPHSAAIGSTASGFSYIKLQPVAHIAQLRVRDPQYNSKLILVFLKWHSSIYKPWFRRSKARWLVWVALLEGSSALRPPALEFQWCAPSLKMSGGDENIPHFYLNTFHIKQWHHS